MRAHAMPVQNIPVLGDHLMIDRARNGGFILRDCSSVAAHPIEIGAFSSRADLLTFLSEGLKTSAEREEEARRAALQAQQALSIVVAPDPERIKRLAADLNQRAFDPMAARHGNDT